MPNNEDSLHGPEFYSSGQSCLECLINRYVDQREPSGFVSPEERLVLIRSTMVAFICNAPLDVLDYAFDTSSLRRLVRTSVQYDTASPT